MKNIQRYIDLVKKDTYNVLEKIPLAVQETTEFKKWYTEFKPDSKKVDYDKFDDCMKVVTEYSGSQLQHCSERLRKNRDLCEAAVEHDLEALQYCDSSFLDDEDFVICVYAKHFAKQKENEEKKRNKPFEVSVTVMRLDSPFKYCSKKVRGSKRVCEYVASVDEYAFKYFSVEMRDNKAVALIAVSRPHTGNYEYCSERLRAIPEVYQSAIKNQGIALKYAPKEVQDNMEICRMAMLDREDSYPYCSERVRGEYEFAEMAIKRGGYYIKYCPKNLQENDALVKLAIEKGGYTSCSERVKNTKEYCLLAIQREYRDWKNLPPTLKYEKEIFTTAWTGTHGEIYANHNAVNFRRFMIKNMPLELCDDEDISNLITQ